MPGSSTCSRSAPAAPASTTPRRASPFPARNGPIGRRRAVARPDRKPESARSLAQRLPTNAWQTLPCRTTPAGENVATRFAVVRLGATNPVRNRHLPPRRGMADHRMARRRRGAERLRALHLPKTRPRAARAVGPAAPDGRTRRPAAQRSNSGSTIRRPQLRRLSPPHRPRHLRARVPDGGTPAPESPASGLTPPGQDVLLPQPVLLLLDQPLPNPPTSRRPRPTHASPPARITSPTKQVFRPERTITRWVMPRCKVTTEYSVRGTTSQVGRPRVSRGWRELLQACALQISLVIRN